MKRTLRAVVPAVAALMLAVAASAQTSLTALNGSRVDVQGQRGKVVILAIGASWLPLSNKQAEYTNVLAKRYTGKDVIVYFVATDSSDAKSKNHASNAEIEKSEQQLATDFGTKYGRTVVQSDRAAFKKAFEPFHVGKDVPWDKALYDQVQAIK